AFERALTGRGHRPFAEISVAQLGENAGIVGAADLAREASQVPVPQIPVPHVTVPQTIRRLRFRRPLSHRTP
ncbi:MAG TPA: hypothetical protein VNO25_25005, partial [Streptosporangiaceae bacterium]|nr:hypothetical protein [Streptosporangiaceae bacterium]